MSKWEVVPGAPDRVNITCLMSATRLCQLVVEMTSTELICFYFHGGCDVDGTTCLQS